MRAKSLQSCPTPCDAMDCSLPGFSVHGILQAGTLEWGLGEQGREEAAPFAAASSSAFSLWTFCRASNSALLGQSIRRFTTSGSSEQIRGGSWEEYRIFSGKQAEVTSNDDFVL